MSALSGSGGESALFAHNRVPPRRPQRPLRLIPNTDQEETAEDTADAEDCLADNTSNTPPFTLQAQGRDLRELAILPTRALRQFAQMGPRAGLVSPYRFLRISCLSSVRRSDTRRVSLSFNCSPPYLTRL